MIHALARPVELSLQPEIARRELTRLLADAEWNGDADSVVLAVHEAMVNAHHHGGGATSACAGFDGTDLVVEVSDRGRGFHVPEFPPVADMTAEEGRGLLLIRQLADDARVVRNGGDVHLVLRFHG